MWYLHRGPVRDFSDEGDFAIKDLETPSRPPSDSTPKSPPTSTRDGHCFSVWKFAGCIDLERGLCILWREQFGSVNNGRPTENMVLNSPVYDIQYSNVLDHGNSMYTVNFGYMGHRESSKLFPSAM